MNNRDINISDIEISLLRKFDAYGFIIQGVYSEIERIELKTKKS